MLKILERTEDSLLIRVPSLYERDIRNLFKRSTSKPLFSIKKNIRMVEEDEATPDEIKILDKYDRNKVDFSKLRPIEELWKSIGK